ncbi:MAG: twin-arginine translocase TatA/TatE family subunit [Candidatus Neomarinimicrobiota bacterium]|tara:strand:+ start:330 stop:563 length:234 start_codon:yes stop_codon:yes gene_type:complete
MVSTNYKLAFFNLGPWEILLVLIVILVLFGAKRLPELARGLGLGINEFRDAVDSSKKEIMDVIDPKKPNEKNNDSEE